MISEKFTGSVALFYENGMLACIDLRDTNMNRRGRHWLFKNAPVSEEGLLAFSKLLTHTKITEEAVTVSLEDFKREYPYKRNNHLLPPIWNKMNKSEQMKAYLAAREYRKYCDRESRWYKPKIAAAWLRAKEWMNDWRRM